MKKYTIKRDGIRLVCLFNNKTELRQVFGRKTEILDEEQLPETIRQSPDLKLYRITRWNNETELDDFIATAQLYGYPVTVKARGWGEWDNAFLIRDDMIKDFEDSIPPYSSVFYEECPDKQKDSYVIYWQGNTWYFEDRWNTYHNGAISENQKVTLTIGQLKRLVKESNDESVYDKFNDRLDQIERLSKSLMEYLKKSRAALAQDKRTVDGQNNIDIFNTMQSVFHMRCEEMVEFLNNNNVRI